MIIVHRLHALLSQLVGPGQRVFMEIYPDTESVWLYRADSAREVAGELRSELFPGVPIDLSKLFAAS